MIFPSDFSISFIIFLRRSSNSPRYLVPAIRSPISRETSSLSLRDSGTLPEAIRRAKPSAIAVFPTPASPMRIGLFLVRRERIWIMRETSSSRPITGSSLFALAIMVKERVYLESDLNFLFSFGSVGLTFLSSSITLTTVCLSILNLSRRSRASPGISRTARKRCSVETNSSPKDCATLLEDSMVCASSGVR